MYITNTISTETLELLGAKTNKPITFVWVPSMGYRGKSSLAIWFNKTLGGRWSPSNKSYSATTVCKVCREMAWEACGYKTR